MKEQFRDYKAGDKIWDSWYGEWVEITEIDLDLVFPIRLSKGCCYLDGRGVLEHTIPRFFCQPFEIPAHAFERPKPDLKTDDKLLVWDDGAENKIRAHFKEWGEGDKIVCYRHGKTSFTTTEGDTWDYYEVYDKGENQ